MGPEHERPGHRCYCGKYGCIEIFLSGAGLAREYFSLSKKELTAEQIAAAEELGQPYAVRSLATYKDRFARSLAAVVNILDPDVIVLGGGISNINSLCDGLTELSPSTHSPMGSKRKSLALLTATPVASEERRGCGRSTNPRRC